MNHAILAIVSGLIILFGIVGSIAPFLPGPPLAWIGLLIYAGFTKFEYASVTGVAILGILTLINILFNIFAPAMAAKGYKASKQSAWGAIIGGVVGIFILGPFTGPIGIFIGPFLGAFIGEYIAVADTDKAWKAARAALIGMLVGAVFQIAISVAIFAYFLVALFRAI